jgi:hypothetical protein
MRQVSVLFAFIVCGCGIRAPLSQNEVKATILSSEEFHAPGRCPDGIPAKRELVTVYESAPVSCESSISECHSVAKFRWRWRSLNGQLCKDGEKESYVELVKESEHDWRVVTMRATGKKLSPD